MNAIETIYKPRSIRKYTDAPIELDKINILLKAAMASPTAANCQPWEFIVVTEEPKLIKVREKCIFARYNAPAAIVVCGNMKLAMKGSDHDLWIQDCSASIENILIALPAWNLVQFGSGYTQLKKNLHGTDLMKNESAGRNTIQTGNIG